MLMRRAGHELPSFLQESLDADDHTGNVNGLPALDESSILCIDEESQEQ